MQNGGIALTGASSSSCLPKRGEADLKGELFELDGEVDGVQGDVWGNGDRNGGEVEQAADAGVDETVGDLLGLFGGDGQDRQLHVLPVDRAGQVGQRLDAERPEPLADLGGVV